MDQFLLMGLSNVDHTVLNHCPECRGQIVSIIHLFGLD